MATETMKTPKFHRLGTIALREDRADGAQGSEVGRRFDISFSSEEAAVERYFGFETLDHSEESVRLEFLASGNAPLLLDHDPTQQIGVVEEARIGSDRKGRAVVRLGRGAKAEEIFQDIKDGIRTNISVGYRINSMVLERTDEKGDHYRIDDWAPMEVSIVSIPADTGVGVGRSEAETPAFETRVSKPDLEKKETKVMPNQIETPAAAPVDSDVVRAEAQKTERARMADIMALARKHNMADKGEAAVRDGLSLAQFQGVVLDQIGETRALEKPAGQVGLSDKEAEGYSIKRAIEACVRGNWDGAGFEREISDQIAKTSGKSTSGFFLPRDIGWQKRDLTVGTDSAGGYLKGTDHRGDMFIDALRDRLVLRGMGARMLSGLRGDVAIPKLTTKTTAYWVAESGSPTEGAPAFGQVTLAPKTVGAFVDMSRKLRLQSDPVIEEIVRADILSQIATAIDSVGIEGGGSNEPTGILQTAGIGDVAHGTNGGAPTWSTITDLVREVEIDNAAMGSLGFLTNPKVKSKLANTPKQASGVEGNFILEGPGYNMLYGYGSEFTNLVPSDLTKGSGSALSALVFGNFSDLMIGEWGTVEVNVDDKSLSTQGALRLVALMDVDVAVRNAQSFAAAQDLVTT